MRQAGSEEEKLKNFLNTNNFSSYTLELKSKRRERRRFNCILFSGQANQFGGVENENVIARWWLAREI